MTWFSDQTVSGLAQALNRTSLKERTIAQNIANVDTPNYKAKHVVFKDELGRHIEARRTNPRHIPFSTSQGNGTYIRRETGTTINNNGNNVDMDREMANLAKTQIRYQALVEQLNWKFKDLRMVLRGGK